MRVAKDAEEYPIAKKLAPPFEVYIDCQGTLDCFHGGRPVGFAVKRQDAPLGQVLRGL